VSLRAFHLLFISLSVLLAVFCAGWAGTEFRADQGAIYALGSALSIAIAVGLVFYGAAFRKKTRSLS
jgi:hypothetical protein